MPLDIQQLIKDKSGDRDYFAMVPGLLWPDIKLCSGSSTVEPIPVHVQEIGIELNIYDKWLYASLKKICGENDGQCFLSTRGLAKFASMSVGQTSKSKANLAEAGLIEIVCKKRSVKGQAIDHITVVDIWEENIKVMKARNEGVHLVNALKEKQERSQKGEKSSQDEHQPPERSRGEGKCSQGETEEELIEEEPKIEEKKEEEPSSFPETPQPAPAPSAQSSGAAIPAQERGDGADPVVASIISDGETKPDYLIVAADCEAKREEAGAWTAPPPAGGDDGFQCGPVDAFCEVLAAVPPVQLPKGKRRSWGNKLHEIAKEWSTDESVITPAVMERAIRAIPDDSEIGWKSFSSPYSDNFDQNIGPLLLRDGQPRQKKPGRVPDPGKFDRATRLTLERLGHHGDG